MARKTEIKDMNEEQKRNLLEALLHDIQIYELLAKQQGTQMSKEDRHAYELAMIKSVVLEKELDVSY